MLLTVAPTQVAVRLTVAAVASLNTVTVTAADVVLSFPTRRSSDLSVCDALLAAVVFHETAYGAVVASTPRLAPSSLNCTPTTPTLSEALAVTVTLPATVAPAVGAVIETVGRVLSPAATSATTRRASRLKYSWSA